MALSAYGAVNKVCGAHDVNRISVEGIFFVFLFFPVAAFRVRCFGCGESEAEGQNMGWRLSRVYTPHYVPACVLRA